MAKAIIVGAGLVGPVLAMYLTRMGWSVSVFERNSDDRHERHAPGRSINLTLCHRGFRALAEVGLETLVRSHSVPAYGRLIHHTDGATTRQNYGTKGEAIYSIERNELNRLLLERGELDYGIVFRFNQKCVAVDPQVPSVTFEDTISKAITHEEADVIFGVDGARSVVRKQLQASCLLAQDERYWHQGYKEINIPVRRGHTDSWVIDKNVLHFWPRVAYMLIGFPNIGGDFTCALHLPFQGENSFESIQTEQDLFGLFERSFPDVLAWLPSIATDFFSRPVNRMIMVRCSPWGFEGKILLLGDAAHAVYPSYGQGANAGFEDCRILRQALEAEPGNLRNAFRAYETARRPSTDAIADLCVEHFIELRDRVGDEAFQHRKEVELRVSELFPELYSPLYWNISFTDMPYVDAVQLNQLQKPLINKIVEGSTGTVLLDDVIRQVVKGLATAEQA